MGKKKFTDEVIVNEIGQEIHILNDGVNGEQRWKKVDPAKNLYTGEQWCPQCHVQMNHIIEKEYYICPECGLDITDGEVEFGDGWPTKEASYDGDFGWQEFSSPSEDDYAEYYNE